MGYALQGCSIRVCSMSKPEQGVCRYVCTDGEHVLGCMDVQSAWDVQVSMERTCGGVHTCAQGCTAQCEELSVHFHLLWVNAGANVTRGCSWCTVCALQQLAGSRASR